MVFITRIVSVVKDCVVTPDTYNITLSIECDHPAPFLDDIKRLYKIIGIKAFSASVAPSHHIVSEISNVIVSESQFNQIAEWDE